MELELITLDITLQCYHTSNCFPILLSHSPQQGGGCWKTLLEKQLQMEAPPLPLSAGCQTTEENAGTCLEPIFLTFRIDAGSL